MRRLASELANTVFCSSRYVPSISLESQIPTHEAHLPHFCLRGERCFPSQRRCNVAPWPRNAVKARPPCRGTLSEPRRSTAEAAVRRVYRCAWACPPERLALYPKRAFSIAREIIRAPSPAEEGNDGLREKPTWRESGPRPVSGKNTGLDVDCTVP